jgi:RNA polymerase sigma factor (sigma-70 family)
MFFAMRSTHLVEAKPMTTLSDIDLLNRTTRGDREAFCQLVARHQSLVCAIAYSVVGDVSRSEDVAQESFVAAWKQLGQLQDLAKFRSWLCGITRNLAAQAIRKEHKAESLEASGPIPSAERSPEDQAVSHEEQTLVWNALEALPGTYREPLVLYYRDEESVARVARSLDLSEDAVKQRLARGREMLRAEMLATVEKALRRTGPGAIFTLAVLGALPGMGAAAASAATLGATGKSAVPLAAAAVQAGLLGGLLGMLGGLAGGALGTWASWKTARYQRERDLYRRSIIIYAIALAVYMLPFVAMALGWRPFDYGTRTYLIGYAIWVTGFLGGSGIWIWCSVRRWRKIVAEEVAAGTPELPQTALRRQLARWEGRQWTSRRRFLGLPLVDINFGPLLPSADSLSRPAARVARGWIALGERAYGVLFAAGNIAVGSIALGTVSIGGVACGALGIGMVGFGGLGMGVLALGGGAIGLFAVGGLAVGWMASGGLALAWSAARGGAALAHDFAIGGAATAAHANDGAARTFIDNSWFFSRVEPLLAGTQQAGAWFGCVIVAAVVMLVIAWWFAAYRRRDGLT